MGRKSIILLIIISIIVIVLGYFLLIEKTSINNLIRGDYYEYISKAIEKKDPESCNRITNKKFKDECFSEIASEITNPEKCEEFKDEDNRNSCYISVAKFHKDISYCDEVIGERKYACFSGVAVITNNESLCEDTTCVLTIAQKKRDSSLCRKIPEMNLYNYSSGNIEDSTESCLMRYAVGIDDGQICSFLSNQDNKNSCFREVAIHSGNITLCKNIKDVSGLPKVTECKIINGNKICEAKETFLSRTDDFKILNCYSLIANNNPDECEKVRDDSIKLMNACYYEISKLNKDPKICEKIEIPTDNSVTCEDFLNYLNYMDQVTTK